VEATLVLEADTCCNVPKARGPPLSPFPALKMGERRCCGSSRSEGHCVNEWWGLGL